MVEIAKHGFVPDPKNPNSIICTSCKLPDGHPVHKLGPVTPTIIHGTARPNKVG